MLLHSVEMSGPQAFFDCPWSSKLLKNLLQDTSSAELSPVLTKPSLTRKLAILPSRYLDHPSKCQSLKETDSTKRKRTREFTLQNGQFSSHIQKNGYLSISHVQLMVTYSYLQSGNLLWPKELMQHARIQSFPRQLLIFFSSTQRTARRRSAKERLSLRLNHSSPTHVALISAHLLFSPPSSVSRLSLYPHSHRPPLFHPLTINR